MVGDRGCGKTMALIFNSLEVQLHLQPSVVPEAHRRVRAL